ncbi:hypothetical protein LTR86_009721 [Recurvomyces mirabilis]|nr:hypothetical protein LTR86_009721 [Recurvomyces mirabilis]
MNSRTSRPWKSRMLHSGQNQQIEIDMPTAGFVALKQWLISGHIEYKYGMTVDEVHEIFSMLGDAYVVSEPLDIPSFSDKILETVGAVLCIATIREQIECDDVVKVVELFMDKANHNMKVRHWLAKWTDCVAASGSFIINATFVDKVHDGLRG